MNKISEIKYNEDGLILDYLTDKPLKDTPEERVRQRFMQTLQADYGYPKDQMVREVPIQSGSSLMTNKVDGTIQ